MKTYNRSLDYVALALNAMVEDKNPVMAARLFAKAAKQSDALAAIATLEASNKHAFELQAKAKAEAQVQAGKRLKASDEVAEDSVEDADVDAEDDVTEAAFGEDDDPLADLDDGEEEIAPEAAVATMASVLAGMKRRAGKR